MQWGNMASGPVYSVTSRADPKPVVRLPDIIGHLAENKRFVNRLNQAVTPDTA